MLFLLRYGESAVFWKDAFLLPFFLIYFWGTLIDVSLPWQLGSGSL